MHLSAFCVAYCNKSTDTGPGSILRPARCMLVPPTVDNLAENHDLSISWRLDARIPRIFRGRYSSPAYIVCRTPAIEASNPKIAVCGIFRCVVDDEN